MKKSFILLEDIVKIAKVLALSNSTSLIGGGVASSGFDVEMSVLKYWKSSSVVILNGKLAQMILVGWFSAHAYFSFSSGVS